MTSHQNITAIITDKRGRVLSIGKNSYVKSHTMMARLANSVGTPDKIYLHAEIDAILRCQTLKKAHKIFVSRTLKSGEYGMAKPCPICQKAIAESGIKIIEHT